MCQQTLEEWTTKQVEQRRVMPFKFHHELMLVDSRLAVFWVAQRTLIVSDLHLEKASYLSRFAHPIPHYDSTATLQRLATLIADYQPCTVISLGDSFHDVDGFSRMREAQKKQLKLLVNTVDNWHWILGNHDPELPHEIGGQQHQHMTHLGIVFCHEPLAQNMPQMFGHYHPKAKQKLGALVISGRCLLISDKRLVMPAFGEYTGGLDIDDPVFTKVLNLAEKATYERRGFIVKDDKLIPLLN